MRLHGIEGGTLVSHYRLGRLGGCAARWAFFVHRP